MKKIILLILIMSISFGENINKQILKKLDKIDNEIKAIKKEVSLIKQEMRLRFEAVDKRFESVDKRFEILTSILVALITGIFALIGFMMWDRRTVVEKAKKECMNEVKEKADKEYVDRLVKAMNELIVLKDEKAIDVFKKYNLI